MRSYKAIATNRRARFDYEITDTFVAGIALLGHEVKSIRAGHVSLKGSFATIKDNELWANNIHVTPYPAAKLDTNYDPTRARKLLVHKKQLADITVQRQSGLSLIVLSIGLQGPFIKVEVGTGRGKKLHDKRETIKRRQASRDAAKAIKARS